MQPAASRLTPIRRREWLRRHGAGRTKGERGAKRPKSDARVRTWAQGVPYLRRRSDDTASRGGAVEQFLAMLAAELLVLLVYTLIKLVFGIEMPHPRARLAASPARNDERARPRRAL